MTYRCSLIYYWCLQFFIFFVFATRREFVSRWTLHDAWTERFFTCFFKLDSEVFSLNKKLNSIWTIYRWCNLDIFLFVVVFFAWYLQMLDYDVVNMKEVAMTFVCFSSCLHLVRQSRNYCRESLCQRFSCFPGWIKNQINFRKKRVLWNCRVLFSFSLSNNLSNNLSNSSSSRIALLIFVRTNFTKKTKEKSTEEKNAEKTGT